MKRIFALTIVTAAGIALAHAGDVRVKLLMSTGSSDEPTTTFAPDTPKIFALLATTGLNAGDKIRAVWIAEDVGRAAPKETKLYEKTLDAEGDKDDAEFTLSKPTDAWPIGNYRVEIYIGSELAKTVKFTVKAVAKSKKSETDAGDNSSRH